MFLLLVLCVGNGAAQTLDIDDILRPELMPTELMMIEGPRSEDSSNVTEVEDEWPRSNGTWNEAFNTMKFHRKMFNEYLCRSYIAGKILSQIHKPLISNRIGKPSESNTENSKRKSRADMLDVKENVLFDPGSSNYKNWLSKTTTLEDVYQHYEKDKLSRIGEDSDEYEGGEITGYAVPGPVDYQGFMPSTNPMQQDAEKHGGGYDYIPHHVHFHGNDDKSSNHVAFPEIFEVALTALAFLSFGLFILQVIMCISSGKTMTMMPMVSGGDAEPMNEIRFRRDVTNHQSTINEMTRRVLKSINVAMTSNEDDGVCLRKMLCVNNRHSRTLKISQKILMPVWGLGMSWLSGRIVQGIAPASTILESLKACALGLANATCETLYSRCSHNYL